MVCLRIYSIMVCLISRWHILQFLRLSKGLRMAQLADLPREAVAEAELIASALKKMENNGQKASRTHTISVNRKIMLRVRQFFLSSPNNLFAASSPTEPGYGSL